MNPATIYQQAVRLGLRLEPRDGQLILSPSDKCPPEFKAVLKANRAALLAWLKAGGAVLPADRAPWLHVARQVLEGEFVGADDTTRESLIIGLRGIGHPLCQRAAARLKEMKAA